MLTPDRCKSLVDSRGHPAGDEAMVEIAMALRGVTRRLGRGWPLRFKSTEVGVLINNCTVSQAAAIAGELVKAIAAIPPAPVVNDIPLFPFSASVSWGVWPQDDRVWDSLFKGTYALLMETWKEGGAKAAHYRKEGAQ
jgi:GGDEF domain-containing protein